MRVCMSACVSVQGVHFDFEDIYISSIDLRSARLGELGVVKWCVCVRVFKEGDLGSEMYRRVLWFYEDVQTTIVCMM